MDKVENGIVINLLIGMNVMSLCVKVRQVNFRVSRSLETAAQIPSKNPGKFVGRISLRKFRLVRKNDSFGEIQDWC